MAQLLIKAFILFGLSLNLSSSSEAKVYTSFAKAAQRAMQGVVNIRTDQPLHDRRDELDPYSFFLDGRKPPSSQHHSLGSGVIFDRSGHIVTNYHVVRGAQSILVKFKKSRAEVPAQVVGVDKLTDLALLKVTQLKGHQPLDFADSERAMVGDWVLAVGNPFGFAHSVSAGIISAKGRVIGTGPFDQFLQTDAPVHPGNSGGPLVDIRARVVGINTAVSKQSSGVGFAIPANLVQKVVADLRKHGKVIRPWLGLVGRNVLGHTKVGDHFDPAGVYGVLVDNLIVDGPAHRAGIRSGDLLLSFGSTKMLDINDLRRHLYNAEPGRSIEFTLYRRGSGKLNKQVMLGTVPEQGQLPVVEDLY